MPAHRSDSFWTPSAFLLQHVLVPCTCHFRTITLLYLLLKYYCYVYYDSVFVRESSTAIQIIFAKTVAIAPSKISTLSLTLLLWLPRARAQQAEGVVRVQILWRIVSPKCAATCHDCGMIQYTYCILSLKQVNVVHNTAVQTQYCISAASCKQSATKANGMQAQSDANTSLEHYTVEL